MEMFQDNSLKHIFLQLFELPGHSNLTDIKCWMQDKRTFWNL